MKILRSEWPVVRIRLKNQSTYYDVDCRKVGWLGKKRLSFTNKNEALAKARQIGEQFARTGLNGLNSQSVATTNREYAGWEKQLGEHGKTLSDAVHFYLEHLNQPVPVPVATVSTLAERWARFKATDTKKQNRERTIGEIRVHAARFGRDFPEVPLDQLDRDSVEVVVDGLKTKAGKPVSPQTQRNYLTKLKQFFNWCVSQQLIASNPAATISVSVPFKVPEAYRIADCRRLLEVVQQAEHRELIAYVALGLFAGLRPSEAHRLSWKHVHWDPVALYIAPENTKVKRARRVELNPTAIAWLNCMDRSQPLIPTGFQRQIRSYRKAIELSLINDGLRHTYATYWLKTHQNRNQLAELIGNSAEIIGRHYVKPVISKDAEAFWKLLPN